MLSFVATSVLSPWQKRSASALDLGLDLGPAEDGEEPPQQAEPVKVAVAEDALDLRPHRQAWEDLAVALREPNPFYEPFMLLPALEVFGNNSDLLFLLIYAADPNTPNGPPLLIGFFPLERVKRFQGLPCRALRLWQHPHCYEATPLLRPGFGEQALTALFQWLATDRLGAPLVELPRLAADGVFHQELVNYLNTRDTPQLTREHYTRAAYRPCENAEAYLDEALNTKRRKELKRLERRLGETGKLEMTQLQRADELEPWIEEFLALEGKGWKGQEGSALASSEADRHFFRQVAAAAFARGRLLFTALRLDGKALAMKCSYRAGHGSYAFKIAFDEEYAKFSPGVLLELDNVRRLHEQPDVHWMDSCAVQDHPMINRLWIDRRTMHSLLVATGRPGSHLLVALAPLLKWFKQKLRRGA